MRKRTWVLGVSFCAAFFVASEPMAWAVGTVSLSSPANGGWVAGTPTLRWTAATSATAYTLTITPAVGAPLVKTGLTTNSYTLTAGEALSTGAGPYSWRVTAYDAAAASADSGLWSFFVDTTPPEPFAITSPETNAWTNSAKALVVWNPATDSGSGIAAYHVYVDGVLCSSPGVTATGAGLYPATCTPGEGTHYWSVSVEDKVGNITWCSECATGAAGRAFRIDNTGPADPAVTGGTFGVGSSNEPDFYGSPGDRMVDTGLTITAGQPLSISATGNWCTLGCASSIGCYSAAGSSSSSSVVPAANCTPFSLIARIGGTFYCVGTSRDLDPTTSGKLFLGINSEFTGCSTPTVTATVTGGRSFNLTSPANGAILSDRFPPFSWGAATDLASGGVHYQLNVSATSGNASLQTDTTQTSVTFSSPLGDGVYRWSVLAGDAVNNFTASVGRSFTIDTLRPEEFRLSSPADGSCTSVPTPSLCWSSAVDTSGIGSRQLFIDNVLAATTTSTCSTPPAALAQGTHSWYVVQADRAGNSRQSSDTRQFWVDYTAPTAPALAGPNNGASLVDPPTFVWTAATDNVGIQSYELYVDGTLTATLDANTLTYLARSDLSLGAHTWYVRALDRCGQGTAAATWSFTMVACSPDGAQHPCPGYNLGTCRTGTRSCTAAGTWSSCSDAVAPVNELCDGFDNNCDGSVDNSTPQVADNQCGGVCAVTPPYIWSPCDGPDADQCQEGHIACNGLNATVCVETTPNNVEICNGRDDDCNGIVDDGAACSLTGTGGMPNTGGATASASGGTSGTTGVISGGTGGLQASTAGNAGRSPAGGSATGGQVNAASGGTTSTSANAGGGGTNVGGAVAFGGSAGNLSVSMGEGGAVTAVAGQANLATMGGAATVATTGGASASGATGPDANAGKSTGGQATATIPSAAGLGNVSQSEDPECECRVASSSKNHSNWALLGGLALLLLGRRKGTKTR